ncbi:MAG: hypothetical protein M1838_002868 [Thelocarpon superellum]|nr:MAG: hypothetical protein M1838_002868 [Thelocarpon superellum]
MRSLPFVLLLLASVAATLAAVVQERSPQDHQPATEHRVLKALVPLAISAGIQQVRCAVRRRSKLHLLINYGLDQVVPEALNLGMRSLFTRYIDTLRTGDRWLMPGTREIFITQSGVYAYIKVYTQMSGKRMAEVLSMLYQVGERLEHRRRQIPLGGVVVGVYPDAACQEPVMASVQILKTTDAWNLVDATTFQHWQRSLQEFISNPYFIESRLVSMLDEVIPTISHGSVDASGGD